MVLADTSVWVDYLRHGVDGPAGRMDSLLADREIVVCGPVVAELLVGARDEDREPLWDSLRALDWASLERDGWRAVGEIAATLRVSGGAVALTDIEIAVAAQRAPAKLWSGESDFERVAAVLDGLELLAYEP